MTAGTFSRLQKLSCVILSSCLFTGCISMQTTPGAILRQAIQHSENNKPSGTILASISVDELLERARASQLSTLANTPEPIRLTFRTGQVGLSDAQVLELERYRNKVQVQPRQWRIRCITADDGDRFANSQRMLKRCRAVSNVLREAGGQVRARLSYEGNRDLVEIYPHGAEQ